MRSIRNAVNELEKLQLICIKAQQMTMYTRYPGKVKNTSPDAKKLTSKSGNYFPNQEINFQTRKLISKRKVETPTEQALQSSSDLLQINTDQQQQSVTVAVAWDEILESDLWGEQPPAEGNQNEVVESNQLKHSTDVLGEEVQGKEKISGEAAKPTVEGQPSAVQLEALKKLGLVLSHGFKTQLEKAKPEAIDQALACFNEDKLTWTAGEMTNPTGYFIKVLRQVQDDGRRPGAVQHAQTSEYYRRVEGDFETWSYEWEQYPARRQSISQKVKAAYPNGEILVDPNEGLIKRL